MDPLHKNVPADRLRDKLGDSETALLGPGSIGSQEGFSARGKTRLDRAALIKNAQNAKPNVSPDTIKLLDYEKLIPPSATDIAQSIKAGRSPNNIKKSFQFNAQDASGSSRPNYMDTISKAANHDSLIGAPGLPTCATGCAMSSGIAGSSQADRKSSPKFQPPPRYPWNMPLYHNFDPAKELHLDVTVSPSQSKSGNSMDITLEITGVRAQPAQASQPSRLKKDVMTKSAEELLKETTELLSARGKAERNRVSTDYILPSSFSKPTSNVDLFSTGQQILSPKFDSTLNPQLANSASKKELLNTRFPSSPVRSNDVPSRGLDYYATNRPSDAHHPVDTSNRALASASTSVYCCATEARAKESPPRISTELAHRDGEFKRVDPAPKAINFVSNMLDGYADPWYHLDRIKNENREKTEKGRVVLRSLSPKNLLPDVSVSPKVGGQVDTWIERQQELETKKRKSNLHMLLEKRDPVTGNLMFPASKDTGLDLAAQGFKSAQQSRSASPTAGRAEFTERSASGERQRSAHEARRSAAIYEMPAYDRPRQNTGAPRSKSPHNALERKRTAEYERQAAHEFPRIIESCLYPNGRSEDVLDHSPGTAELKGISVSQKISEKNGLDVSGKSQSVTQSNSSSIKPPWNDSIRMDKKVPVKKVNGMNACGDRITYNDHRVHNPNLKFQPHINRPMAHTGPAREYLSRPLIERLCDRSIRSVRGRKAISQQSIAHANRSGASNPKKGAAKSSNKNVESTTSLRMANTESAESKEPLMQTSDKERDDSAADNSNLLDSGVVRESNVEQTGVESAHAVYKNLVQKVPRGEMIVRDVMVPNQALRRKPPAQTREEELAERRRKHKEDERKRLAKLRENERRRNEEIQAQLAVRMGNRGHAQGESHAENDGQITGQDGQDISPITVKEHVRNINGIVTNLEVTLGATTSQRNSPTSISRSQVGSMKGGTTRDVSPTAAGPLSSLFHKIEREQTDNAYLLKQQQTCSQRVFKRGVRLSDIWNEHTKALSRPSSARQIRPPSARASAIQSPCVALRHTPHTTSATSIAKAVARALSPIRNDVGPSPPKKGSSREGQSYEWPNSSTLQESVAKQEKDARNLKSDYSPIKDAERKRAGLFRRAFVSPRYGLQLARAPLSTRPPNPAPDPLLFTRRPMQRNDSTTRLALDPQKVCRTEDMKHVPNNIVMQEPHVTMLSENPRDKMVNILRTMATNAGAPGSSAIERSGLFAGKKRPPLPPSSGRAAQDTSRNDGGFHEMSRIEPVSSARRVNSVRRKSPLHQQRSPHRSPISTRRSRSPQSPSVLSPQLLFPSEVTEERLRVMNGRADPHHPTADYILCKAEPGKSKETESSPHSSVDINMGINVEKGSLYPRVNSNVAKSNQNSFVKQGHHTAQEGQQMKHPHKKVQRKRTWDEMCYGDSQKKWEKLEKKYPEKFREEPVIDQQPRLRSNPYYSKIPSALQLQDPAKYMQKLHFSQQVKELRQLQSKQQKQQNEIKDCTFDPFRTAGHGAGLIHYSIYEQLPADVALIPQKGS